MSYFVYIVLPFVEISLIFLLSPELSGLFIQVVLLLFFSCVVFFFLFVWTIFVDLMVCVPSRIYHPGFDFVFVLSEGIPIFSQINFAPA